MKSCVSTLTNALLCHSFSVLPGHKTAVLDFWSWTQTTVPVPSPDRPEVWMNPCVKLHCCSADVGRVVTHRTAAQWKHRCAEWKQTRRRCETAKTSAATESVTVLLGSKQNDRRLFFFANKDTCRRRYRLLLHISRPEHKRGSEYECCASSS